MSNVSRSVRCLAIAAITTLAACSDVLKPEDVVLTIVSPEQGDSVLAGDSVTLSAMLLKRSGIPLATPPITWSTTRGATLGQGWTLRAVLADTGTYDVIARADFGDAGFVTSAVAVTVLFNGSPSFTTVQIPTRLYVHDTVPLIAAAADPESSVVHIEWYGDGNQLLGQGDTLMWSPGAPVGDRTVTARAADQQGFHSDSAVSVRALSDDRVLWLADAGTWYPGSSDIDLSMLALADDGSLAVGFYRGSSSREVMIIGANGRLRWQQTLDAPFLDHSSGLTYAPDGTMFVFDFQGGGYAFDPGGTLLWKRQVLGQDPHGRFALDPAGRLYAAGNDGASGSETAIVRLDPATGADIWRVAGLQGYNGGPSVLTDSTLTAQFGGAFYHLTPDGAAVGDTVRLARYAHYMSAADARGYTYLSTTSNSLVAVGPNDTVRWEVPFPSGPGEAVVGADTAIYTASRLDPGLTEVMRIRPDGHVYWTRALSGTSYIPRFALLADGTLLVATGNYVYTLLRTNGAVVDTIEFPALVGSALAVGPTGTIYVVTGDKRLEALRGTVPLDPDAPWPIWRRDNRRTASVPR
jgi:hypothetical protein